MAEIRFFVGWVCWQWSLFKTYRNESKEPPVRQLKLPLLGCAVALLAGCSTMGSNSSVAVNPLASSGPSASPPPAAEAPADTRPPKWELTVPDEPAIETWVKRFSESKHQSFQTQLDRARFYVVPVQQIFEEKGLPKDAVFVALVESGFSPTAHSSANAVGMWQFISATGKRFGLEQNQWVDERRHPFKAARAAADYLSFLYDTFSSWPLAFAAYNAGERAVQDALNQSGYKTFWELSEHGYLPAETRDYVPKVLATIKIVRNSKQYGFHYDPKRYVQRHETIPVPGGTKLAWIEKKTGVPKASLQDCNPELCKPETPPGCPNYELCVPVGMKEIVASALTQAAAEKQENAEKAAAEKAAAERAAAERAAAAEKAAAEKAALLAKAAEEKAHAAKGASKPAPEEKASRVNGAKLAENNTAHGKAAALKIAEAESSMAGKPTGKQAAAKAAAPNVQPTATCKVNPGDTWYGISRKYGCTPDVLASLNGATPTQPLKAGLVLKVPAQEAAVVTVAALPKKESAAKAAPPSSASAGKKAARTDQKTCKPIRYPVRPGDTLWSIAEKFSTSVDTLCEQNELKPNQKLVPGNLLTIYSDEQDSSVRVAKRKN